LEQIFQPRNRSGEPWNKSSNQENRSGGHWNKSSNEENRSGGRWNKSSNEENRSGEHWNKSSNEENRSGEHWNKSSKVDVPGSLRTNVPYHLKIVSLKNLFLRSKNDGMNIFFTQERQHFSF
jgi:hypothetical protein